MTLRGLRINNRRGSASVALIGMARGLGELHACPQDAVGAMIVQPEGEDGWVEVIAVGWNAAPAKARTCLEAGCDAVPETPTSRAYSRHLHAEVMALATAAKTGSPVDGCWCYVTRLPCPDCVKVLAAAGVIGVSFPRTWSVGVPPPVFVSDVLAWGHECGINLASVTMPGSVSEPEPDRINPGRCDVPGCLDITTTPYIGHAPDGELLVRCPHHALESPRRLDSAEWRIWNDPKAQQWMREVKTVAEA